MTHSHDIRSDYEQPVEVEIHPETPEELAAILRDAGVPVDSWDPEISKSPKRLLDEIRDGDSVLVQAVYADEDGVERPHVLRRTNVIWIDVYGRDQENQTWRLREQRREFNDGRKPDARTLPASLGEKGQVGESLDEAVARALREEALITEPLPVSLPRTVHQPIGFARSYPGLPTQATEHYLRVELPTRLHSEGDHVRGFAVPEHDKTTYFVWEPVQTEPQPN